MATLDPLQKRLDAEVEKSTTLALQVLALRLALRMALGVVEIAHTGDVGKNEAERMTKTILDVLEETGPE